MSRIGVLVVDDSVVIRRLVSRILDSDPEIEVLGTAPNGQIALARLVELNPDVVTMDVEMPVMDGIETVKALRKDYPKLPVVMFSTLTESGAACALDALAAGADDYVTKPTSETHGADPLHNVQTTLIPKIKALVRAARTSGRTPQGVPPATSPTRQTHVDLVAIGASTGGPDALAGLLAALPADLPAPVVVVQHMPKLFTKLFAERLDRHSPLSVAEAADGMVLARGTVLVAPGDYHLAFEREGALVRARLHQAPPENYCRPAVDVTFRSAAEVYGAATLAVVLTGMGKDGRRGAEWVRSTGGRVIVQDEATSVVWGMPGTVALAGLADDIAPLDDLPRLIHAAVTRRSTRYAGGGGATPGADA